MTSQTSFYRLFTFIIICFLVCSCDLKPIHIPQPDLGDRSIEVKRHFSELAQKINNNPQDANLWGRYGSALLIEEFKSDAEIAYQQAHTLEPSKRKWLVLSSVCIKDISPETSFELMKKAYLLGANTVLEEYYLAQLYEQHGDLKAAKTHYQQANMQLKNNVPIQLSLAKVLFLLQEYSASLALFEQVSKAPDGIALITPYTSRLQNILNQDLSRLIAKEASDIVLPELPYPYFDEVIRESRSANLILNQANNLFQQKLYNRSINMFTLAKKELNNAFQAPDLSAFAYALVLKNYPTKAKRLYWESIQRFPKYFPAYLGLADVFLFEKNFKQAKQYYQLAKVSSVTLEQAMAIRGLSRITVMQGDLNLGLQGMLSALELAPKSPLIHEDLARIYGDLQQFPTALMHLQKAESLGMTVDPKMLATLQKLVNGLTP